MMVKPAGHSRRAPGSAGFSLVELMVALALAAIISLTVMVISNTARDIYESTTIKVEVSNKFRLALLTLDGDFSNWIDTMNLEFFADGRGPGTRINGQWDEGEELPDKTDEMGPGVLDGGLFRDFDEFASITERHYRGVAKGADPQRPDNQKVHDAYQAYFRTMTYIDGKVREANVEYMLLDPNRTDENHNPLPPLEVVGERMADLVLVKIVRYHDIHPEELLQVAQNFPIVRRRVEVASNVTDFKVEYLVENRYNKRVAPAFQTPQEDFRSPAEDATRPIAINDPNHQGPIYRKIFGYGSMKLDLQFPRAIAYKALQGDQQIGAVLDHRPVRFGWLRNADIQFAELVRGSRIYIYTESDRGGVRQPGAAGQGTRIGGQFPTGLYTVKSNISGQLEFYEDIDSSQWQGDSPNILYKASFIPQAIRITLRVLDDKGATPKTLQRVIWVQRKAR